MLEEKWQQGKLQGFQEGFSKGNQQGYSEGWNEGFKDAIEEKHIEKEIEENRLLQESTISGPSGIRFQDLSLLQEWSKNNEVCCVCKSGYLHLMTEVDKEVFQVHFVGNVLNVRYKVNLQHLQKASTLIKNLKSPKQSLLFKQLLQ